MRVETLRWTGSCLELVDQRALPTRVAYLACHSAADVADAIRKLAVRGAPAIGCAAAYGVALAAIRAAKHGDTPMGPALDAAFAELRSSRPTAVNLFWALDRMAHCRTRASALSHSEQARCLLEEAHAILREDIAGNRRMGAYGAELLPDSARVLTHCNAGALATGGHGTALGVIRSAVEAGKRISVFADETRPVLQGARLTAWELVEEGIPVTLITDGTAGHLMSRGEIDCVIVGADRIAANGDVANKIGTYTVAVLAQRHGIPFYVAAPWSTIDSGTPAGADIPIEERDADEVTGYGAERWSPPRVQVRNPAFDVTPHELVSAIVTERGILRPSYSAAIRCGLQPE
jgi:methylthioribose-1-phosphate isomerase